MSVTGRIGFRLGANCDGCATEAAEKTFFRGNDQGYQQKGPHSRPFFTKLYCFTVYLFSLRERNENAVFPL